MIRTVSDAKLLGRGGAAFPTGVKWQAVATQPVRPHYVICNADESEPGTFKDRVVMEQDPFAVIEALTMAGFACGAEKGFLYIRGEYRLATERLGTRSPRRSDMATSARTSWATASASTRAPPRGRSVHLRGGDGAFNSLEGKRGEPRNSRPSR